MSEAEHTAMDDSPQEPPKESIITSLRSLSLEAGFALTGCVAAFCYAAYQAYQAFVHESFGALKSASIYLGTALQGINIVLAGSMIANRLTNVTTILYVVAVMYSLGFLVSLLTLFSGISSNNTVVKHTAIIALVFYANAIFPIALQLTQAKDDRGIQSFSHPISAGFTVAVTQTFLQTVNFLS